MNREIWITVWTLFILFGTCNTSFAQDNYETYVVKFKEHVFIEKTADNNRYSLEDLKTGQCCLLSTVLEQSELINLVFTKMIT